MKKIVLFATAIAFTATAIGQSLETRKTASKSAPTKETAAPSTATKESSTKPAATVTKPDAAAKVTKGNTDQITKPSKTKVIPSEADEKKDLSAVTAVAKQPSPDEVIKVNTIKHDFGKIKQGVPVTYSFEIKNISGKPVVVENSYASCGCTVPEKIVEPIAPGATAKLKVQYNAASAGPFTKQVHIKLAGLTQEKIVEITGEVLAPETKPNN